MTSFTWKDGERTIRFGRGAVAELTELLGGHGYVLLSSERAIAAAPEVAAGAESVELVPQGAVGELSRALLTAIPDRPVVLVALGGGRMIDTAKAISAVRPGTSVAAIPTTLSGAEMTTLGASPTGHSGKIDRRRPALVINDPDLSASQPLGELAASSANALAHAVEASVTTLNSPVPTLAAREAQRLIDAAWLVEGEEPGHTARGQLAQAALLAGYAIDASWYGLSHVMSQTLRAIGGIGHGSANAAVLPHAIGALERRMPGRVDPDGGLTLLAERLAGISGAASLRRLGIDADALERCAEAASHRTELELTPPRADRDELLELYRAAW